MDETYETIVGLFYADCIYFGYDIENNTDVTNFFDLKKLKEEFGIDSKTRLKNVNRCSKGLLIITSMDQEEEYGYWNHWERGDYIFYGMASQKSRKMMNNYKAICKSKTEGQDLYLAIEYLNCYFLQGKFEVVKCSVMMNEDKLPIYKFRLRKSD